MKSVAGLSDRGVQQIVSKHDELSVGQDAGLTGIGAAPAILLLFLITDLLCFTSVYPINVVCGDDI
ncbi:MAG TPA: hypothetical protein VLS27_00450 [Gammaproteobacteria bacterium]|nr:hypothetical protein [Gammaproteobacteria bacterium]